MLLWRGVHTDRHCSGECEGQAAGKRGSRLSLVPAQLSGEARMPGRLGREPGFGAGELPPQCSTWESCRVTGTRRQTSWSGVGQSKEPTSSRRPGAVWELGPDCQPLISAATPRREKEELPVLRVRHPLAHVSPWPAQVGRLRGPEGIACSHALGHKCWNPDLPRQSLCFATAPATPFGAVPAPG